MKKILVVDDDPVFRRLMCEFLQRSGYAVEEAVNGLEAIASIKRQTPDLVVLNVIMPAINGYEVVHYIRFDKQLNLLPVVMVTSKAGAIDAELCNTLGVHCLHKDLSPQIIVDNIVKLIEKPQDPKSSSISYVDREAQKHKEHDRLYFEREKRMIEDYVEKSLREKSERNKFLHD